jgi:zinc/manganese transport system permease protein
VAMLLGSAAVVVGLLLSFHLATATAATIAGLTVLTFFVALAIQELRDAVVRRRAGRHAGRAAA